MKAADKAQLEALVSDQLSYGHSSGKVETKAEFVGVIAGKKTIGVLQVWVKDGGARKLLARQAFSKPA